MSFNPSFDDYNDVRESTRQMLYGLDALFGMLAANTDPSKYALAGMYKDTHTVSGVTFTNNGDGTISLSGKATAKVTERLTTEPIALATNGFCEHVLSVQDEFDPDNAMYYFLPYFVFTAVISGETNTIRPTIVWHVTLTTDDESQGYELTYDSSKVYRGPQGDIFSLWSGSGELTGKQLTGFVNQVTYDIEVTVNKNVTANKTIDVGIYTPNLSLDALKAFVKAYTNAGASYGVMNSAVYPIVAMREDYSRLKCALSAMMGDDIEETYQTEDGLYYTRYMVQPDIE